MRATSSWRFGSGRASSDFWLLSFSGSGSVSDGSSWPVKETPLWLSSSDQCSSPSPSSIFSIPDYFSPGSSFSSPFLSCLSQKLLMNNIHKTIAIDIRLLGKRRTGDETVFFHLTKEILKLDKKNKYSEKFREFFNKNKEQCVKLDDESPKELDELIKKYVIEENL